jgi:osmotically-inducible protein OsmY
MTQQRCDGALTSDVKDELVFDPATPIADLHVSAQDGVVTLEGSVGTEAAKMAATGAALRVGGVRSVTNRLIVEHIAPDRPSDTDISGAVRSALLYDTVVPLDRIDVTVTEGIVILSGTVDSQYQRQAAMADTVRVAGMQQVIGRMVVAPPEVMADEIEAEVERAFRRHGQLADYGIDVDVAEGGHVTLLGTVTTHAERREAEEVACRARGVTSVTNILLVTPGYEAS